MRASVTLPVFCIPSAFGWTGAAGEVGMSPSTHFVPGALQTQRRSSSSAAWRERLPW
jgi:hypothetical protein